ncbi:Fiber protein Fb17 [Hibiscus syriacus]|uniref:Fiber protein Fb17 n=1 Tax=Hibiscus syriacus TaxID=106335 RepID=A0A6A3BJF4_HIBSY|nr:Fiber protein Fb17 [Hibiscus syriacus]
MDKSDNYNDNTHSLISRDKLGEVAGWLSATVVSAFFSSLERFSCVNLSTDDPDDDDNPTRPRTALSPTLKYPFPLPTDIGTCHDIYSRFLLI